MDGGKEKEFSGEIGKGSGQAISSGEKEGTGGTGEQSTGTSSKRGTGTGTKTRAKKQGIPGLAAIEVPEAAKTTTEKPVKKPRTKRQKNKEIKELSDNLQVLIKTGFDMVAIRAGDIWELTEDEAENIAEPVARILDRYNLSEQAGEYGDYIALAVALGLSLGPRIILHQQLKKEDKKGGRTGTDATGSAANCKESRPALHNRNNIKELLPALA